MESEKSRKPVFMQRKKGMPFEEFKKVCIKQFREAGLLHDEEPTHVVKNESMEELLSKMSKEKREFMEKANAQIEQEFLEAMTGRYSSGGGELSDSSTGAEKKDSKS